MRYPKDYYNISCPFWQDIIWGILKDMIQDDFNRTDPLLRYSEIEIYPSESSLCIGDLLCPPLPIPATHLDQRYHKYVASRDDMLFIRRCMIGYISDRDAQLIASYPRYRDIYLRLEDPTPYISSTCKYFMTRSCRMISIYDPSISPIEREMDSDSHSLWIPSEIGYENLNIKYIGDNPSDEDYILYIWMKEADPIYRYNGEILIDILPMIIEVINCPSLETLYDTLHTHIGGNSPHLYDDTYTIEDIFQRLRDIYLSGKSECEMFKLGYFHGGWVRNITNLSWSSPNLNTLFHHLHHGIPYGDISILYL